MKQHDLRQRCLYYLCRKCPYSCQCKIEFEKHILSHSSENGNLDDIRTSGEIGKSDFGMGLTSNYDDTEDHLNVCLSQSAPLQRDPNADNNPENHLNHLFLPLTEMIHGDAYSDTSSVDYFQSPVEQDADVESLPITPQFTQLSADQSLSACESAVEQDVDVESLPMTPQNTQLSANEKQPVCESAFEEDVHVKSLLFTPQNTQLSADEKQSVCQSAVEQDVDFESLSITPQFTQLSTAEKLHTHNDEPFELAVTEPNSICREGVFLQYNHASSPDSIGPEGEQYIDSVTSREGTLGEIITHLDYSGANTKGKQSIETQILACDEFRKHHSECFVILEDIYGTPYMPASNMDRVHLRTINLNTATTSAPPCKYNAILGPGNDRQSCMMKCYHCCKQARTLFAIKIHVKKCHPDLNIIVRDMKQHELRQRCLYYLCRKCPYSCQCKIEFDKHILSHSSENGNSDDIRKSGEISKSDFGMGLTSNYDDTEDHLNVCLSQSAPFQRDPNADNSILDSYKHGKEYLGDIWMRQFDKIDPKWEIPMDSSDKIRSVYRPDIAQLWKVASYLVTSVGKTNSCSVCQYTSNTYDHVLEHVGRHLGLAIWTCPYCAFKHRQRSKVVDHLKTVHIEVDQFVIRYCGYSSDKVTDRVDRASAKLPTSAVLTQELVKDYATAVLQLQSKGFPKGTT